MKFLLDNDVPVDVLRVLKREGHEANRTTDVLGADATDPAIFKYAVDNGKVIVTCNRNHFLSLATNAVHPGVIVLVRRRSRVSEAAHLLALLRRAGESGIVGNINFA